MIYDDDGPVQDVGAVQNFGVFYKMVDHGWIRPLAVISDSGNGLSAPGIHALAVYYRHTEIPIGANKQDTPVSDFCKSEHCLANDWNAQWVAKFDPIVNDTRANYQDCGVLYRKTLAHQPSHSAVVVETGFATCLMQLLRTSGDSISPLSGTQLVKDKVKSLVLMGGDYPTGKEWNFMADPADYSALFSTWRSQNGYPPIYMVGFKVGTIACSGAPANAPITTNPIRNANAAAGQAEHYCEFGEQRPVWDQLAIMYGAWGKSHGGTRYFDITAGGTNTVDSSKGTNVWTSAVNSGHYYLIAKAKSEDFAKFLDGYSHAGLLAESPRTANAVLLPR
jgi:hypothetical protein